MSTNLNSTVGTDRRIKSDDDEESLLSSVSPNHSSSNLRSEDNDEPYILIIVAMYGTDRSTILRIDRTNTGKDVLKAICGKLSMSNNDSAYHSLVMTIKVIPPPVPVTESIVHGDDEEKKSDEDASPKFKQPPPVHCVRTIQSNESIINIKEMLVQKLANRYKIQDTDRLMNGVRWYFKDCRTNAIEFPTGEETIGEDEYSDDEEEISHSDLGYLAKAERKGYLMKRSSKDINLWKRYYCVLADSKIYCVNINRDIPTSISVQCEFLRSKSLNDDTDMRLILNGDNGKTYMFSAFSVFYAKRWRDDIVERLKDATENNIFNLAEQMIVDQCTAEYKTNVDMKLYPLLNEPSFYQSVYRDHPTAVSMVDKIDEHGQRYQSVTINPFDRTYWKHICCTNSEEKNSLFETDAMYTVGWTPLMWAASSGSMSAIKYYIENDNPTISSFYDINTCNIKGMNALLFAALNGHSDIVIYLLNHGAAIESVNKFGNSLLHCAALYGHVSVVKALWTHSPQYVQSNIDQKNIDGMAVLLLAAEYGFHEMVQWLYEHQQLRVDTSIVNKDGESALVLAVIGGHVDVVRVLMRTLNYEALEVHQSLLQEHQVKNKTRLAIVKAFFAALVNDTRTLGSITQLSTLNAKVSKYLLHHAIINQHWDVMKWLVSKGAGIHLEEIDEMSGLSYFMLANSKIKRFEEFELLNNCTSVLKVEYNSIVKAYAVPVVLSYGMFDGMRSLQSTTRRESYRIEKSIMKRGLISFASLQAKKNKKKSNSSNGNNSSNSSRSNRNRDNKR